MDHVLNVRSNLHIGKLATEDGITLETDQVAKYFKKRIQEELSGLPRRPVGPQIAAHVNLAAYAFLFYMTYVKGSVAGAFGMAFMPEIIDNTIHTVSHKMIF